MPTQKQRAAQARFSAAARQAKREGKKGKAFSARVGQILKGSKGSGGGAAKRPSASGGFRRAAKAVHSAGKGFLGSLSIKRGLAAYQVLDGVNEGLKNFNAQGADGWAKAQAVLMPMVDGAISGKMVMAAGSNSLTAPGLTGELLNWRPFGGKMPKVTLAKAVNAAPSLTGWTLAAQKYRFNRPIYGQSRDDLLLPRVATMSGIQVRKPGQGRQFIAFSKGTILDSPATPLIVGGVGSKILAKAHVF